jgi:DEAD/DEAH box helicase domain-containing protein
MFDRTLVFDLETKCLANEVGGWSHIDKLGLSAAVLLHVETGEVLHFLEQDADDLIANLLSADHVVGFNVLRFDYTVLRPYGFTSGPEMVDCTTDLLEHIYQALGFRLSLDNLAEATLGIGKSADGLQAVAWFREGKLDKVLDYCEQDVRVTYRLWMHGIQNRQVKYRDRNYRLRAIPVSW